LKQWFENLIFCVEKDEERLSWTFMDNYNIIAIIKSIRKLSILERKIKIAIAKQEVLIVILKSVANYD